MLVSRYFLNANAMFTHVNRYTKVNINDVYVVMHKVASVYDVNMRNLYSCSFK